ncbi:hypothetical protein [Deinococcus cellulosilyticus]|uniref:Uncharacterized protein n=1 Tax=Deinococcus cellulosilyticus (strain DSM 18568 / NBRC 106333 / KACC 11606 / 5516J-15) TaxID=1223518 RepID=A0A511N223_DEIC1|nr:hypothetical protein [Deinococcus cellulosilyticus]GEM46471.1 hypothetical protein DC3_21060 [Deinococcus cellulosilyticus NBRC 106333 = KACC 11606]
MDVLERLYQYHQPLSEVTREQGTSRVLLSPLTPILALNAAYGASDLLPAPKLVLSQKPVSGLRLVQAIQVGHFQQQTSEPAHLVEQVSWLQTRTFAKVLCHAWGMPTWEELVSQHLSMKLQEHREYVPLLSYQEGQPTGCALLKENQVHLWGVSQKNALTDLLNYAAQFSGQKIETTLTAGFDVPLQDQVLLGYWLA